MQHAEKLARAAYSFHTIASYLQYERTLIEDEMFYLLEEQLQKDTYDLVCFTVPFLGNLFLAFRDAQFIKEK
ncbi:MAG: hypothetical protein ACI9Z4_001224 [Polaribacter sp.]|jgi:hypothetical protein